MAASVIAAVVATMTDDIVTRLRTVDIWSDAIGIMGQAADEIERLRKLGDDLTAALENVDGFIAFHSSTPRRVEQAIEAWEEHRRGNA